MLLILLSYLATSYATSCTIPPGDSTINVDDILGECYVQYMIPDLVHNNNTCWKNIFEKTSQGYEATAFLGRASTGTGDFFEITRQTFQVKPGTQNIVVTQFFGIVFEYTIMTIIPNDYGIIAGCQPDGTVGYMIYTADINPSPQQINEIDTRLRNLNLPGLSDFTKICN